MALQEKYRQLIDEAKKAGVGNLNVREQNNVLYIDGDATEQTKNNLWNIYNKIDPDYRAGDLVLNVNVPVTSGAKARVVTEKSNLNIRQAPGTDEPIVGKAAHHEIVTIVRKENDQWTLIRTDKGVEGYVYNQYLSQV